MRQNTDQISVLFVLLRRICPIQNIILVVLSFYPEARFCLRMCPNCTDFDLTQNDKPLAFLDINCENIYGLDELNIPSYRFVSFGFNQSCETLSQILQQWYDSNWINMNSRYYYTN